MENVANMHMTRMSTHVGDMDSASDIETIFEVETSLRCIDGVLSNKLIKQDGRVHGDKDSWHGPRHHGPCPRSVHQSSSRIFGLWQFRWDALRDTIESMMDCLLDSSQSVGMT